jgi:hypothetical protein
MSFVSPDPGVGVSGVAVSTAGSVSAAGPAVAGVHGADVLAFTGAGPGTLYLAIIGFATLLVGAVAMLFGRRRTGLEVQAPVNGLADLAPLAAERGH